MSKIKNVNSYNLYTHSKGRDDKGPYRELRVMAVDTTQESLLGILNDQEGIKKQISEVTKLPMGAVLSLVANNEHIEYVEII